MYNYHLSSDNIALFERGNELIPVVSSRIAAQS